MASSAALRESKVSCGIFTVNGWMGIDGLEGSPENEDILDILSAFLLGCWLD